MKLKSVATILMSCLLLFALSACQRKEEEPWGTYINYDSALDDPAYNEEESDVYLLEQGYPESFLAETGSETKRQLQRGDAVFQAQTDFAGMGIDGLSGGITVSDISGEQDEFSVKIVTFNWEWRGGLPVEEDKLSFTWEQGYNHVQYSLLSGGSLLEYHGEGDYLYSRSDAALFPEKTEGTFIVYASIGSGIVMRSVGLDQSLEGGTKVSVPIDIQSDLMFQKVFAADEQTSTGEIKTIEATYVTDPEWCRGSYSIMLIKRMDPDYPNDEDMNTVTATYRHGEEEQSVSCTFTDFLETA